MQVRISSLLSLLMMLTLPVVSHAQTEFTPISNLNQPIGSGSNTTVSSSHSVAASFTTGNTPTSLAAISVSMQRYSGSGGTNGLGAFALALYGNSYGWPGTILASLVGNNYPTSAGVYTYTTSAGLDLMPNTTYWIVGSSSTATSSAYRWTLTSYRTLDPGSVWTLGRYGSRVSGGGWVTNSSDYLEFSVTVVSNVLATPLISSLPTASAITYGQTLASSTLSGGAVTNAAGAPVDGSFAFATPATMPGLGTAGESVIFTPTDSIDYTTVTTSVPVTVVSGLAVTPLISSLPTASAIIYGQTLASSTLSGGAVTNAAGAPVDGSFAFATPATMPGLGMAGESVIFTPTDSIDYTTVTTSVPVTVVSGLAVTPLISSLPTASAIIYGQTLASSTLSGGAVTNAAGAPVDGSFAFTTPETMPGLGMAGESVIFTPTDFIDYTTVTTSVPVTVVSGLPVTPLIASAPTASAIIYGQTLASSTLSGGAVTNAAGAPVDGSFAFTTPATMPGLGTNSESVIFTPTDFIDYTTVTTSVPVTVMVIPLQTEFTPISNLNQPIGSGGNTTVSSFHSAAASFTTGNTPTSLAAISVSMQRDSGSGGTGTNSLGAFALALYSNSSGLPGTILRTLAGNNYPTIAGVYIYTNTAALELLPNTTYWIVGSSSTSGGSAYRWTLTSYTTLDSGSIWTLGLYGSDSNGEGWVSSSGLSLEFSVTVVPGIPTTPLISSLPTASAIVYGQTLAASTLSGGAATNAAGVPVPGSFAFANPAAMPGVGTAGESVIFTPTDSVDYTTVTTSVPVTVVAGQAVTPLIASVPAASTITFGQTLAGSILSGGGVTNAAGAPVAGSFAFTSPATTPGLGMNSEPVTFTPTDTTDYTVATTTVQVMVIPFVFTTNAVATKAGDLTLAITGYNGPGGAVIIPDAINGLPVTSIAARAFYECHVLTSLTLGPNVTDIGEAAFNVCSSLTNLVIGTNVNNIEPVAFAYCGSLANVTIPDSVTNIGNSAFDDDARLTSVAIGSGVTSIGLTAFSGFNNLQTITVDTNNPAFSSMDGVLFNQSHTLLVQYPPGLAGSYTIPDGVISIGNSAFADCTGLTSVIIPDTVNSIGPYAFIICSSLTSVTIPYGVTNLQEYTFAECYSLTNVTISGSVASIGSQASSDAKTSGGGVIRKNVSSMTSQVFYDCTSLTSIYFIGDAPAVDASDFASDDLATVYYLPGTTGWGNFTQITGVPSVLWNPQLVTNDGGFGVQSAGFGFNIVGASNLVVVVEACTNLAHPVWSPVTTLTLNTFIGTNGMAHFTDSQWTNYPCRFYGFSWP